MKVVISNLWFDIDSLIDDARKIISTPETVKQLIAMIEYLYKSDEYMDDLDNLENLVDILLQIIMDDGKF